MTSPDIEIPRAPTASRSRWRWWPGTSTPFVFTIGVAGGIALVEALRRRSAPAPAARVLSVEAGLLLAFMLVGRIVLDGQGAAGGSWDYYLLAVLAVLAMGWQTAALRRVAGVPIHTTFVTGILTHLGPGDAPTTSLPSRSGAPVFTVGSGPATSPAEGSARSSRCTGTCGR